MFFDHILRMDEVREFEKKDLSEHHKAKLAVDRRTMAVTEEEEADAMGRKGAENILDRAVMEHNVLACAKVSDWRDGPMLGLMSLILFVNRCMTISISQGWESYWI